MFYLVATLIAMGATAAAVKHCGRRLNATEVDEEW
jgi:hypothetical protein